MNIIQIGLNHRTAPVEIREQVALSPAKIPTALQALHPENGHGPGDAQEGVLLSTCNRLEVYALVQDPAHGDRVLRGYLARVSSIPHSLLDPYLQVRHGQAAVKHLCKVACGVDSMVLGESQIQGQVIEAHELALAHGTAGTVLNALFRTAIQAGKRARTETAINEHATSISHVAVQLALQIFDNLADKVALLIGAGEMAELAAKNLVDHGVGSLLVLNRSPGRAANLARQFCGEVRGWDSLTRALWEADIVISSTAAPHAILHPDAVATAMQMRHNHPLFIIDIAVPRDVEPAVGALPNVFLYDIDDLKRVIDANLAQRQREIPRVQAIIQAEVVDFMLWYRALDVVPTVVDLRRHIEQIREMELERAMRRLENLSDQERNVIRAFSQRLVNKILHQPTARLKHHANGRDFYQYAEAVRDLFGLPTGGSETDQEQSRG